MDTSPLFSKILYQAKHIHLTSNTIAIFPRKIVPVKCRLESCNQLVNLPREVNISYSRKLSQHTEGIRSAEHEMPLCKHMLGLNKMSGRWRFTSKLFRNSRLMP